jgi:hypothetical protein
MQSGYVGLSPATGLPRLTRNRLDAILAVAFALVAGPATGAPDAGAADPSKQCEEFVAKLYDAAWPSEKRNEAGVQARFEAHYNTKWSKCFYLESVSTLSRSPAMKRILTRDIQRLLDAGEGTVYGMYDAWNDNPPMTCWLGQRKCASRQEWERLVGPYMGD